MKVRCRPVDSVLAEVEGVQRHIAQRAHEISRARAGAIASALEDWMNAERETIWRPALEVRRTKDAFVIEAAVAGIEPKQFDVQVTPTELVLSAQVHHSDREQEGEGVLCEFAKGPLFRSYKFSEPVDPAPRLDRDQVLTRTLSGKDGQLAVFVATRLNAPPDAA